MFESIVIQHRLYPDTIFGELAEKLLFYKKVKLVCGPSFFKQCVKFELLDSVFFLIEIGYLELYFEDSFLVIQGGNSTGVDFFRAVVFKGTSISPEERLEREIYKLTNKRGASKRVTSKIINVCNIYETDSNLTYSISEDLKDEQYLKNSIVTTIKNKFNETIPIDKLDVDLNEKNGWFHLNTNINEHLPAKAIKPIDLIGSAITTRDNMMMGATLQSNIICPEEYNNLMQLKFEQILNISNNSRMNIGQFSEYFLNDFKAISHSINSGKRSFGDFCSILNEGKKFRNWVSLQPVSSSLTKEYLNSLQVNPWFDTLPNKIYKWSAFTGASLLASSLSGSAGMILGISLSVIDSFILDEITKGWKPQNYIDEHIKPFVR